MKLYFNPLSSFSQKTLIAFYEKNVTFKPEVVTLSAPGQRADFEKINPIGKVPILVLDNGQKIPESSVIIEWLDTHHNTGTKLIPTDKEGAFHVRLQDRLVDCYLAGPLTTIVMNKLGPESERNPKELAHARACLDKFYPIYERSTERKTWACGEAFTMADCAAAPVLAYLRHLHPFDKYKNMIAYANRLNERPSFARVLKEAAPSLAKLRELTSK
jgi:glutathione S-transferase